MKKGVLAYLGVVIIAAIAESITMEPVTARELPVITLVQNEPVYHENTEIVGLAAEVNMEKFSNPPLRSGDDVQTATVNDQEEAGTSSAGVPATERLTRRGGVFNGPSGKETWYPSPLGEVVRIMRSKGYSEEEYPYWIRDDGVRMFGSYVMVAADTNVRPKGTILETSLGTGMVCDHCVRAQTEVGLVDIAVSSKWK